MLPIIACYFAIGVALSVAVCASRGHTKPFKNSTIYIWICVFLWPLVFIIGMTSLLAKAIAAFVLSAAGWVRRNEE